MAKTVLITGARAIAALDLARDFHQAGYEVHLADSSSAYVSRWSNKPSGVHRYASPALEPDQFKHDIEYLVKKIRPEIVIPTCEEIFHLAKPSLEPVLKDILFSPSLSVLHALHAKDRFVESCREMGIEAPETHRLDTLEQVNDYQETSGDWVFKPCYSRFGSRTVVRPTPQQLSKVTPSAESPWVAQRFVAGQEICFYAVAQAGTLIALSGYTSTWRLGGGASYVFTAIPEETLEMIKPLAQTIASKCEFTGQFSCDLIMDDEGKIWPIECNPRATSGLHLLTGEGELARDIMGDRDGFLESHDKTKYISVIMLTHGLAKAIRRGQCRDWLTTLNSGDDVISTCKDRWPLLGGAIDSIEFMWSGWKHGCSATQATTLDIEWNGEKLT